nr:hypothetical protein [Tanacetum cinerariifolium]
MADLKFVDQHNMVACLEKTEASYIEQFWNTVISKTVNLVKQIHAIVDGKPVVISESSVRSDLIFNDKDDERPRRQETILVGADAQTRFKTASKRSSDPPLLIGGHTPGSDEGRPNLLKLMNICTKLSNRVLALEDAKTIQDKERNDDQTEELNFTNGDDTEVIIKEKGSGEKGGSTNDQTLIKMRSEKLKEKGVAFVDVEEPPRLIRSTTTLQPLPTIDPKDKELDRAQKQEETTIAALTEEFDEIQVRMDADHELAKETIGSKKSKGNKEQTTYKNPSQEQDDYLPQTYG